VISMGKRRIWIAYQIFRHLTHIDFCFNVPHQSIIIINNSKNFLNQA
jgi:hypothetical protein